MDAATRACAPPGKTWQDINWVDVRRQVRGLQTRIVKATQEGRYNKVKALQWLQTHSFIGKALAIKRVTTNRGKNILQNLFRKSEWVKQANITSITLCCRPSAEKRLWEA